MKRLHEKYAEMIQKLLNTESGLYELMYFQNIGGLCLYHWYLSYSPLHDSLSQPDCLRSTYQVLQGNPVISTEIFYW